MGFHRSLIRRVKSVINTWLKDAYRLSYVKFKGRKCVIFKT